MSWDRMRLWGTVQIFPDYSVLPRYLDSGDRAFGMAQRAVRKGGAGKKKAKSKQRICKPPVGGWVGGDPQRNGAK